jgi:hypothetical protein
MFICGILRDVSFFDVSLIMILTPTFIEKCSIRMFYLEALSFSFPTVNSENLKADIPF